MKNSGQLSEQQAASPRDADSVGNDAVGIPKMLLLLALLDFVCLSPVTSCVQDVEVRHVYREGNQVADTLCNEAYRCPGVWTLHQLPPPPVWAQVEDDRHGAVYERVRR